VNLINKDADLKENLLHGNKDSANLAEKLMNLWITDQVAWWPKLDPNAYEAIPTTPISIPLEDLFEKFIHAGHLEIVYEYLVILQRKNLVLPANLLALFVPEIIQNIKIAQSILSVLGNSGEYLCHQNKNWNWLLVSEWNDLEALPEFSQKLFAFENLVKANPQNTYELLVTNIHKFEPKKVFHFLHKLLPFAKAIHFQIEPFIQLASSKEIKLLFAFLLCDQNGKEYQNFKSAFNEYLIKLDISLLQMPSLKKNGKAISADSFISIIPSEWIYQSENPEKILETLHKNDLINALIENVEHYHSEILAGIITDWLIRNGHFTENYKVETLSEYCNHSTFNSCMIRLLQAGSGDVDLEACFRFINQPIHFWDDQFLSEILKLAGQAPYENHYNLEVFFNMIPFRIKPPTDQPIELPVEIKKRIHGILSYDKILNFRKLMRS